MDVTRKKTSQTTLEVQILRNKEKTLKPLLTSSIETGMRGDGSKINIKEIKGIYPCGRINLRKIVICIQICSNSPPRKEKYDAFVGEETRARK